MEAFEKASYRSQLNRLRKLAESAVLLYPIQAKKITFIKYGENATFKVTAKNGDNFLLRVHRNDYHSDKALYEELRWLDFLAKKAKLLVPRPVRSKNGQLFEKVENDWVPPTRRVSLLHWIGGRFIEKSVLPNHLYTIGQIVGRLHKVSKAFRLRYRYYWTADGILGPNATLGGIDHLKGISEKNQKTISKVRKKFHAKLKRFEEKCPDRLGMIHADVHFGNFLRTQNTIGLIDFDDSGFGFYAYDLVLPLLSLEGILIDLKEPIEPYKRALLKGYSEFMPWDKYDEELMQHLWTARKLLILGWYNSRADNPKLGSRLIKSTDFVIRYLREQSLV